MASYEIVTVDNRDNQFDIGGELVQIHTERPHVADQIIATVERPDGYNEGNAVSKGEEEIEKDSSNDQKGTVVETPEIDYEEVDGVGPSTADNLKEAGYTQESAVKNADVKELAEVDRVGESTAENIKDYAN